jgi:hypothetical protein
MAGRFNHTKYGSIRASMLAVRSRGSQRLPIGNARGG